MSARLRIVPATCSLDELRRRMERLCAGGLEHTLGYFELSEELFRRTNGAEGTDPRLTPWARLIGATESAR